MPGTSGLLSPYSNMDGLYFNNSQEPDDFMYDFKKDLEKIMKNKENTYIELKVNNKEDYHKALSLIHQMHNESMKVYSTSIDENALIIENEVEVEEL